MEISGERFNDTVSVGRNLSLHNSTRLSFGNYFAGSREATKTL